MRRSTCTRRERDEIYRSAELVGATGTGYQSVRIEAFNVNESCFQIIEFGYIFMNRVR